MGQAAEITVILFCHVPRPAGRESLPLVRLRSLLIGHVRLTLIGCEGHPLFIHLQGKIAIRFIDRDGKHCRISGIAAPNRKCPYQGIILIGCPVQANDRCVILHDSQLIRIGAGQTYIQYAPASLMHQLAAAFSLAALQPCHQVIFVFQAKEQTIQQQRNILIGYGNVSGLRTAGIGRPGESSRYFLARNRCPPVKTFLKKILSQVLPIHLRKLRNIHGGIGHDQAITRYHGRGKHQSVLCYHQCGGDRFFLVQQPEQAVSILLPLQANGTCLDEFGCQLSALAYQAQESSILLIKERLLENVQINCRINRGKAYVDCTALRQRRQG